MQLPGTLRDTVLHGNFRYPYALHETYAIAEDHLMLYLHWHTEAELLLVLSGDAIINIGAESFPLHEGEMAFIPPYTLHGANTLTSKECHFFAFVFSLSALRMDKYPTLQSTYIVSMQQGELQFPMQITQAQAWQREILTAANCLYQLISLPPEDCELLVHAHLLTIWHHLYHHARHLSAPSKEYYRLKPAIAYIHENYAKNITIAEIAAQASLSISRFSALFQKAMHISPVAYLIQYRLHQSCILLQSTNKTIAAIAMETGFENLSNFNRLFQREIGCTPSAHRQEAISLRMRQTNPDA